MARWGVLILVGAMIAGCGPNGGNSVAPAPVKISGPAPATTAPAHPSPTPTATAHASATPTATAKPSATPTPSPTPTATVSTLSCNGGTGIVQTVGPSGGTVTVSASVGTFSEKFAPNQLATSTSVALCYVPSSALTAPLSVVRHKAQSNRRSPQFTAGAGNTYVLAFTTAFSGSQPGGGVALSGTGIVPTSIAAGTQLNIAIESNNTWVDVGSVQVGSGGAFQSSLPTAALPGVSQAGTYLVYLPPAGTNTTQINLGFALVADDGTATSTNGLQFVQLEDGSGNPLATPTTQYFPLTGVDLDGEALTPDASYGAVVDGGNTVYFFSGLPQHTFTLSPTTIDVSNYGGDGDSIVTLPTGDEVVVTADDGGPLAIISGILSGTPVIADTISNVVNGNTNYRDGLVISNDGSIMLARGQSGIDVYQITKTTPHTGSTGQGTTSYSFALTQTISSGASGNLSSPFFEDGRDGMAISPTDPTRAVVVGYQGSAQTPVIQILTGLGSSSVNVQSRAVRVPTVAHRVGVTYLRPEPSAHRKPLSLTPTSGSELLAVTITPDGTTAYVSSNAGIITLGGVNTGNLTQIGGAYAPTISVPGGGTCTVGQSGVGNSLGVLPDGKYLVLDITGCELTVGTSTTTQGHGTMLTIPIGAGGVLGAPVGQLDQVVAPFNDQIIFH